MTIDNVLVQLVLLGLALLLGATAYESVVMAPNYERDIPSSIELARQFLKRTTPAHYFRILSPVTLALLLAALATSWHVSASRPGLIAALAGLVVADVITFAFHYPRLAVMFRAPLPDDSGKLRKAAREWAVGNVVRAVLLVVAFLAVLQAFVALMVR
jgi:small-conductance mechanosensitive channel